MDKKKIFRILYFAFLLLFLSLSVKPVGKGSAAECASMDAATLSASMSENIQIELSEDGSYARLSPTDTSNRLSFSEPAGSHNMLVLVLKEPVTGTVPWLYYSENGIFAPENMIFGAFADEGRAFCFLLPSDTYSHFSLSLDASICVERISFVSVSATRSFAPNPIAIVLTVLWLGIGILMEKKWHIYNSLKCSLQKETAFCKELYTKSRISAVLHLAWNASFLLYAILAFADFAFAIVAPDYGKMMLLLSLLTFLLFVYDRVAVRKSAHPSVLLLGALLLIGSAIVLSAPTLFASWDEQYHFGFVDYPAALLSGQKLTNADFLVQYNGIAPYSATHSASDTAAMLLYASEHEVFGVLSFLPEGLTETLKENFHPLLLLAVPFALVYFAFIYIAYLPAGAACWLCRVAGGDLLSAWTMGEFANLLLYALVLYFGIRQLKRGGALFAGLALIPTALFLSVNFNYDSWVIAFALSGLALFFSALESEKPLTKGKAAAMISLIAIGCGPKAIYFVLLFPLLFLPARCFESKKSRKRFCLAVLIVALAVLLSFLLPFLINTDSKTDLRGGSDVSAGGQISYILNNPLTYTKTLLRFLAEYTSLTAAATNIGSYAYLGSAGCFLMTLFLGLLLYAAFADKGVSPIKNGIWLARAACFFTAFAALALVATSLYVGYTPVGHQTVLGCQFRYIFPILPLLLYAIPTPATERSDTRSAVLIAGMALCTALSYFDVYFLKFL